MVTLRADLTEWTDPDGAAFVLAVTLGILEPGTPFLSVKHVFWGNNELGNALHDSLATLANIGVLEHDSEQDKYRWSSQFNWRDAAARPGR